MSVAMKDQARATKYVLFLTMVSWPYDVNETSFYVERDSMFHKIGVNVKGSVGGKVKGLKIYFTMEEVIRSLENPDIITRRVQKASSKWLEVG